MRLIRRAPRACAGVLAFTVFSLILTALVFNTLAQGTAGQGRHYEADFTDASGVRVGDDVRIAGVRVGRVESRELHGDLARVRFSVGVDQQVQGNTRVRVSYLNVLGQRYLALEQGTGPSTQLPDNAVIPATRTSPALDLTSLFNAFKPLFDALEPADVNALATDVIQIMQGEGGTLRHLMAQTAELTGHLSDRDEVISRVIDNVTEVMATMAAHREDISSIVTAMHDLVGGLAEDSGDIDTALVSMEKLTGATHGLLEDTSTPITKTVTRMRKLSDSFVANDAGLDTALRSLPVMLGAYSRSMSYGSWLGIYICNVSLGLPNGPIVPGRVGPNSSVCR